MLTYLLLKHWRIFLLSGGLDKDMEGGSTMGFVFEIESMGLGVRGSRGWLFIGNLNDVCGHYEMKPYIYIWDI